MEKPDSFGYRPRPFICLEQDKDGGMGSCSKPNSELYPYPQKAQAKRLSSNVEILYGTEPINLRTAVYETRMYGGV